MKITFLSLFLLPVVAFLSSAHLASTTHALQSQNDESRAKSKSKHKSKSVDNKEDSKIKDSREKANAKKANFQERVYCCTNHSEKHCGVKNELKAMAEAHKCLDFN